MFQTLSLVLPIMVPSWRFFKAIEPSPRVQWAVLADGAPTAWREFRPRPMVVTPMEMLFRWFWNPARNDALFLVSLAERILQNPTPHSIDEINTRILGDLDRDQVEGKQVQFRLVFVSRDRDALTEEVLYMSDPVPIHGGRHDI